MPNTDAYLAAGGEALRYDYPLTESSLVYDVGGYQGDFASGISSRYGCEVVCFEPVPEYARAIRSLMLPRVSVITAALGPADDDVLMVVSGDSSHVGCSGVPASMHSVRRYAVPDLIKINIEGGEYALLDSMLYEGWLPRFIQVQFHDGRDAERARIRSELAGTHDEMWCYPFVWESWGKRDEGTVPVSDL